MGLIPRPVPRRLCGGRAPGYIGDVDYLAAVDEALAHVRQRFDPEIVVYVAGTDPYFADPLGTLQVSELGLQARDRHVAEFARETGAALVALPAGGYTPESPRLSAAGFVAVLEVAVERGR